METQLTHNVATHIPTPWIAQPHVRPVLITWSRQLALGVTLLTSTAILVVGFVTVAHLIMQSVWCVMALLLGLSILGIALWFPTLVREESK